MSRLNQLEHQFVESFPKPLEPGVLYVSTRFRTAAHLCACGCGQKVVTPFSPAGWSMSFDGDSVTLAPSVGNGRLPCRSHYFIKKDQVVWSYAMTDDLTAKAQMSDARARARYYGTAPGGDDAVGNKRNEPTAPVAETRVESSTTPPPTDASWWGRMRHWLR